MMKTMHAEANVLTVFVCTPKKQTHSLPPHLLCSPTSDVAASLWVAEARRLLPRVLAPETSPASVASPSLLERSLSLNWSVCGWAMIGVERLPGKPP